MTFSAGDAKVAWEKQVGLGSGDVRTLAWAFKKPWQMPDSQDMCKGSMCSKNMDKSAYTVWAYFAASNTGI